MKFKVANRAEYSAWVNMKLRCYMPSNKSYKDYGARGIKVHDDWLNSFESFFNHIGKRPSKDYSLDRIDNNGNYEPGNVRWATRLQQQSNRRNTVTPGVTWDKAHQKWEVRYKGMYLGRYKDFDDAKAVRAVYLT